MQSAKWVLSTAVVALLLAAGTVTAQSLIDSGDVKDGSLTGKDVKNKSLTPTDFRGSVRGANGRPGAPGPQGAQGPAGAQGPQGSSGSQGPPGADGEQGEEGVPGSQGPQGAAGAQGPQGAPGPQGAAGPQGPAGAQGPQGPAGPGTLFAYKEIGGGIDPPVVLRPGTCAEVAAVTITVPRPGTVHVRSTLWVSFWHSAGQSETLRLNVEQASPVQCPFNHSGAVEEYPVNAGGDGVDMTVPVERVYTVGAGTHTYRLGAIDTGTAGQGSIAHSGWLSAVFYPS